MYTSFHNLKKPPFTMTADPAFLFLTKQHREALAGLRYAVLGRKGFVVLSGVAGSGKTTLLAWVLNQLPADRVRSSVILYPTLTTNEFLEAVMLDFDMPDIPASKAQRIWTLQKFLVANQKQGHISVLIIDEAQKLSIELLEEIRLLGNLDYGEEKLLQIVMLGQPELDDLLNRSDLSQLKQRIAVRLTIGSLAPHEVEQYIRHRWKLAGGYVHPFMPDAIERLKEWSGCIPRLINSICDCALMLALADESQMVTAAHVREAAEDLQIIPKPVFTPPAPVAPRPAPGAVAASAANGSPAYSLAVGPPAVNGHSNGTATLEPLLDGPRRRSIWGRVRRALAMNPDSNGTA